MTKTTILALVASLLITGCGEKSPEDVAQEFVLVFTEADIAKAENFSTEDFNDSLRGVHSGCNQDEAKEIEKRIFADFKLFDKKAKENKELGKKMRALTKLSKKEIKKIEEDNEKYVSSLESTNGYLYNVPKEKQDDFYTTREEKYISSTTKAVYSIFDSIGIKENTLIKDIIARGMAESELRFAPMPFATDTKKPTNEEEVMRELVYKLNQKPDFKAAAEKVLEKRPTVITKECVDRYTNYGYVKRINVIETKEISPDKTNVRLELVNKDDKSTKVKIQVEKIKGEWKISEF